MAGVLISVFFSRFSASKRERRGCAAAVYLLAPILFIGAFTAAFLFSSDTFRWLTHTFVPLLGLFLYVSYYEGEPFWKTVRSKLAFVPVPALAVYFVVYAAVSPAA